MARAQRAVKPALAASAAPASSRPAHPLHVLIMGASITTGMYADAGRDYRSILISGLRKRGYSPVVETWARPGAGVQSVQAFPVPRGMDLVVVQLATNDAASSRPTEPAVFATEYAGLLGRLRAGSPQATLVCLDAWSDPSRVNRLGVRVGVYDQLVQQSCAAVQGRFVDLSSSYADAAYHGPPGRVTARGRSDRFHPNDAGHARLAQLVLADVPDRPV
jgi:lysophospholipase L1-like esterase